MREGRMRIKTKVRAGGIALNHNETLVRDTAKGLKVKTGLKGGPKCITLQCLNHNETLVRDND